MSKFRQEIDQNGYVVIPGVVPRENVEAVVRDIWEHTGADPDEPETWYAPERIASTGMEDYSKPQLTEKKNRARAASNESR